MAKLETPLPKAGTERGRAQGLVEAAASALLETRAAAAVVPNAWTGAPALSRLSLEESRRGPVEPPPPPLPPADTPAQRTPDAAAQLRAAQQALPPPQAPPSQSRIGLLLPTLAESHRTAGHRGWDSRSLERSRKRSEEAMARLGPVRTQPTTQMTLIRN